LASKIKLGKGGLGNKGGCAIRFNYKNTSFAVSCCHLMSGQKPGYDK